MPQNRMLAFAQVIAGHENAMVACSVLQGIAAGASNNTVCTVDNVQFMSSTHDSADVLSFNQGSVASDGGEGGEGRRGGGGEPIQRLVAPLRKRAHAREFMTKQDVSETTDFSIAGLLSSSCRNPERSACR
jgi:hypothetical protein